MKKIKKKRKLRIRDNKFMFGTFAILLVILLVINATYAWASYTDWVKNHMQSGNTTLAVRISETFTPGSKVIPGKTTTKSVKVKNVSQSNAIIRVQLKESILGFQIDTSDRTGNNDETRNANLKIVELDSSDVAGKVIQAEKTDTWKQDYFYDTGKSNGSKHLYYTSSSMSVTDSIIVEKGIGRTEPLSIAKLHFNPAVYTAKQAAGTNYWFYDNGYYYYSKVLEPEQETTIDLLQSVSIDSNAALYNRYKGALYDITAIADGKTANVSSMLAWTNNSDILEMLKYDPLFSK